MPRTQGKNATPPRARFVVHQNTQGYWVASEKGGLVTGIFSVQRDALRFALARLQPGINLGHRRHGSAASVSHNGKSSRSA